MYASMTLISGLTRGSSLAKAILDGTCVCLHQGYHWRGFPMILLMLTPTSTCDDWCVFEFSGSDCIQDASFQLFV